MSRLYYLLIFFALAASALGAPSINQPFAELKLADGRVLRNARLMSFNSSSVFVRCDSGILQVSYRSFPAELQPQLNQARANAMAQDEASAPPPARNHQRPPPGPIYRVAPQRPPVVVQMSEQEMERMELVRMKAKDWAEKHFHSGALMRSPNVRIFSFDLQYAMPRRVSDQALLYTVNGRCLRACTDLTSGNDLAPEEIVFSVTVEVDATGQAEVVDSSEGPGDQSEQHKQELVAWAAEAKQAREAAKTRDKANAKAQFDASRAQFEARMHGGNDFELSQGMSQDQVRALWGPPARIRTSNGYDQWTYIDKGRDEMGRLCNVVVVFLNGQVATWNND